MTKIKKGLFVTFEGPEGCGKSTQVYKITEALKAQGYDVVATCEPGGTSVGQQIREILLNPDNVSLVRKTEVLLFAADRKQHVEEKILPALGQKKIVVCDRYIDSTTAYQVGGRKIAEDFIAEINQISTNGLKPEKTFLIDIPVAEGLKRATKHHSDRFEKEFISFHESVRNKYLELAKVEPQRIKILNGLNSIDELHQEILKLFTKILKEYVV